MNALLVPSLIVMLVLVGAGPASPTEVSPEPEKAAQEAPVFPEPDPRRLVAAAPGRVAEGPIPPPPPPPAEVPIPPATMAPSPPIRLRVPAIGLDSELLALGLAQDGTLDVPPGALPASWYNGSPTPGSLGPAIISGHVDYGGELGVFYDLRKVAVDDEVAVERQDGSTAVFRVTRVEQFPKGAFPTEAVYGNLDHAGLRLITCGGSFDRAARSYLDNIVVFAELVPTPTVEPTVTSSTVEPPQ